MFDLVMGDIQFLLEKQNNRCALSGVSFKEEMFSIDKINPFGNYTKFNIQLLTISVNRMKSNFPQDVFLRICANIAGHQQEPDDAT